MVSLLHASCLMVNDFLLSLCCQCRSNFIIKICKSLILFFVRHEWSILIGLFFFLFKLGIATKGAFIYFYIIESSACLTLPFILVIFTLPDLHTPLSGAFLVLGLLLSLLLLFLLILCLLLRTDYLRAVFVHAT